MSSNCTSGSGAIPGLVLPQEEIDESVAARVGGKAHALARMARAGIAVPAFVAVTTDAYEAYLDASELRARILFELERKDFADMRWEELWDAALRVRSLFLTTPLPEELRAALAQPLAARFGQRATVVRSSAPGEDSPGASFAGLHESYVNVRGADAVLEHVKLVWASLWSDAALLYRRELGLDPKRSVMAVVVQEIVSGERSGVAFSRHPNDDARALVEAVHGLNQGLVDGVVEPDRWIVDRRDGAILEHRSVERREMITEQADGVHLVPLPRDRQDRAPLTADEVARVHGLTRHAECHFQVPQDVEWTLRRDDLFALQSRPITTLGGETGDGRSTYLSLRRSFESLQRLRRRIEDEDLPGLAAAADRLEAASLDGLDDAGLRAALQERKAAHDNGVDVYTADFIPFAHGARLFGAAYNNVLQPEDPYEFTELLADTPMISLRRNAALERVAAGLRAGDEEDAARALDEYMTEFGDAARQGGKARAEVLQVARRLAARPAAPAVTRPAPADRARRFIEAYPEAERQRAAEVLDLGRASWRLRDDDNLYLDRLERLLVAALEEAERRGLLINEQLRPRKVTLPSPQGREQTETVGATGSEPAAAWQAASAGLRAQARQIVGQPAGPGLAVGTARVIKGREDLATFADGEILVCDAIAPDMTFIVPLAAGIVERRGGMLIHGAIIAREYGLPCVTGVPRATELIRSGDRVTVDGYLGIVTIG
jgi:pyruvate,water dikinase